MPHRARRRFARPLMSAPRLVSAAVILLAAAQGPAAAQGSVSGTIHAAPGEDVLGTWVFACHLRANQCDFKSPQSRGLRVTSSGTSTRYEIGDLAAGQYVLIAFKDRNDNDREDPDDSSGQYARPDGSAAIIAPPMRDVDVRLRISRTVAATPTPAAAAATSGPQPPASAATSAALRGAPAPTNPPGGRALEGIYVGIRQNWNVSKGVPIKYANEHLFALYADGRAIYAAPHHGLRAPFDWSRCSDGAICGSYQVRGNEVHAAFNNGYRQTFIRDGKRLIQVRGYWEGHEQGGSNERRPYMQVDLHNGLRLDGRWAVVDERDGREPVSITLTRDGRFVERGLLQPTNLILPWGEREARERLRMTGGSGTYSIAANTLELRYENGPVLHFLFTVTPEVRWSPLPERIQINRIELAHVK